MSPPPWQTAYHHFRVWRLDDIWEYLNTVLREQLRASFGRNSQPSAGIIDSQSVRTTGVVGVRGYDGAKRVNGRKRHVLVNTGGLVLRAKVHTAEIQDRAGVPLLLEGADGPITSSRASFESIRAIQVVARAGSSRTSGGGCSASATAACRVGSTW
jgi:transposase